MPSIPGLGSGASAGGSEPPFCDDPTTFCIPQPSPRITPVGLFPIEFVQTKDKVVILYQYFNVFRSIPIGRPLPDDIEAAYLGNSVARWDGDTLVIEAFQFKEGGWVTNGAFTSDALRVTERFSASTATRSPTRRSSRIRRSSRSRGRFARH